MPNFECLLTLNDRILMAEGPGGLLPLNGTVETGESPLEACGRIVRKLTGFNVSPSCAGVVYAGDDQEHEYTLVFVADAPAEGADGISSALRWVQLPGIRHEDAVQPLHRKLIPLLLTADGPMVVFLEGDEPRIRDSASIPHARLSPLVFAVAM